MRKAKIKSVDLNIEWLLSLLSQISITLKYMLIGSHICPNSNKCDKKVIFFFQKFCMTPKFKVRLIHCCMGRITHWNIHSWLHSHYTLELAKITFFDENILDWNFARMSFKISSSSIVFFIRYWIWSIINFSTAYWCYLRPFRSVVFQ